MKKTYIVPVLELCQLEIMQMMANSQKPTVNRDENHGYDPNLPDNTHGNKEWYEEGGVEDNDDDLGSMSKQADMWDVW